MRRLLYLALALVLLALIGLAFLRVKDSPAYAARAWASRVEPGMGREEVLQLFGEPSASKLFVAPAPPRIDFWEIDANHELWVYYESMGGSLRVRSAMAVVAPEESLLDKILDIVGCKRLNGPEP